MSADLIIANPRRRKRRRKMSALQLRYFGGARRKRRKSSRSRRRPRASGSTRFRRRRLSNPRISVRGATQQLIPAAIGALGAIGVDVGMAYIPLPSMLQSGMARTLTQLVGALGLGFIAAKVPGIGKSRAQAAVLGALTIILYNAIRPAIAGAVGDKVKGLAGLADFSDGDFGAYMNPAPLLTQSPISARQKLGAYMSPNLGNTTGMGMF